MRGDEIGLKKKRMVILGNVEIRGTYVLRFRVT
jgi:hypothetical protein